MRRPTALLPSGATTVGPSRAPTIADPIDVPMVARDAPLRTGTVVRPDCKPRPWRLVRQRAKRRRAMVGNPVLRGAGMAHAETTSVARGTAEIGPAATGLAAMVSDVRLGAATATATNPAGPNNSRASVHRPGSASPIQTHRLLN